MKIFQVRSVRYERPRGGRYVEETRMTGEFPRQTPMPLSIARR